MNPLAQLYPSTIKEREVFYFCSTKISSPEPHYFICIKREGNDVLLFACSTTQLESRQRYIESKGYPISTLVYIDPKKAEAKFKKECFVDCNSYTDYSLEEFTKICKEKDIEFKGTLDEDYYLQILIGLHQSPDIAPSVKLTLPPIG